MYQSVFTLKDKIQLFFNKKKKKEIIGKIIEDSEKHQRFLRNDLRHSILKIDGYVRQCASCGKYLNYYGEVLRINTEANKTRVYCNHCYNTGYYKTVPQDYEKKE